MVKDSKQVSFVLGSYNRLIFLKLAIESIRKEAATISHEIIVVDGGSNDGSLGWLLKQKDIITIVQFNRGAWKGNKITTRSWGYFMNLGFKCAQGKYVCMISDDSILVPGAVKNGIVAIEKGTEDGKKIGGCAFYFRSWPEEKKHYITRVFNSMNSVNHGLFRKEALETVNYIDEDNFAFYYGDIDLSMRIEKAGFTIIASNGSFVEHSENADVFTRVKNITKAHHDFLNFKEKWKAFYPEITKDNIINKQEIDFTDKYQTVKKVQLWYQLKKMNIQYVFARIKNKVKIRELLNLNKK